jgi:hypothetical protein
MEEKKQWDRVILIVDELSWTEKQSKESIDIYYIFIYRHASSIYARMQRTTKGKTVTIRCFLLNAGRAVIFEVS